MLDLGELVGLRGMKRERDLPDGSKLIACWTPRASRDETLASWFNC